MRGQTWRRLGVAALFATGVLALRCQASAEEAKPAPVAVTLPSQAPEGAVVLFSGKADEMRDNWVKRRSQDPAPWPVADGAAGSTPQIKTDINSKQEFGDCFLHVEFMVPTEGHGNAGVGLMGRYEVQILNSFGKQPEPGGCGAFYNQKPPMVVASKPAGEWQSFDIIFRAPRFDAEGKVVQKARATVFQNGILVQNNEEFNGPTGIQYEQFRGETPTGPIILQGDHDLVKFRNIWVVPM